MAVPADTVARTLADDYPAARLHTLVPGVSPLPGSAAIVETLRRPVDVEAFTGALGAFVAGRAVIVRSAPPPPAGRR